MIELAVLAITLTQRPLFPPGAPYRSRLEFYQAKAKVTENMSAEQVLKILGKPDTKAEEPDDYAADEVWCYGVDPETGFASLGRLWFRHGKVFVGVSLLGTKEGVIMGLPNMDLPYVQLIEERKLRAIFRVLDKPNMDGVEVDPLNILRSAKILIPLGDEKARFALGEFERSTGFEYREDQHGILLEYLFPSQEWLTKTITIDELPIQIQQYTTMGDFPFESPVVREVKIAKTSGLTFDYDNRKMRVNLPCPGSDPFQAAKDLEEIVKKFEVGPNYTQTNKAVQSLLMVRNAFRPHELRWLPSKSLEDKFDELHQEFLTLNAKWDDKGMRFTLPNGRSIPDPAPSPMYKWKVPGFPTNLRILVNMRRFRVNTLNVTCVSTGFDNAMMPSTLLRIRDNKTGKQLGFTDFDGSRSSSDGNLVNPDWEKFIVEANSTDISHRTKRTQIYFNVPEGTKIDFELVTKSQTIRSPIFQF